jgi:hypothetical protein
MKSPASIPTPTTCSASAPGTPITTAAASRSPSMATRTAARFRTVAYHANQPTYTAPTCRCRATSPQRHRHAHHEILAGPNAVLSEIWLLRRKPDAPPANACSSSPATTIPPTSGASPARNSPPSCAPTRGLKSPSANRPAAGFARCLSPTTPCSALQELSPPPAHRKALWTTSNLRPRRRRPGHRPLRLRRDAGMERLRQNGRPGLGPRQTRPRPLRRVPRAHPANRPPGHPASPDFTTTDELYTCLAGDTEIQVLAEATSKVDQKDYPMAFVLTPGQGRVFHSPLGHDLRALEAPGARQLYLQGTRWATGTNPQ